MNPLPRIFGKYTVVESWNKLFGAYRSSEIHILLE